jgi:16S rRNA (cytidine1402-2'-O)-methyltransferase
MLYIVATPIGNLKDITLRAIDVLKSVDLIACEDTRHTKILLDHYAVKTPTTSFYQHNRLVKAEYLINLLKEGKNIALVSDAGMPGILDPGYNLINAAIKNKIEITVIPGACAFINALVLSGRPAHEFYFSGFLPNKKISRTNKLRGLAKLKCTIIFYESSHRIIPCLQDVQGVFGDKEIVLARELTKKFEEIIRNKPAAIIEKFKSKKPLGEFVVII